MGWLGNILGSRGGAEGWTRDLCARGRRAFFDAARFLVERVEEAAPAFAIMGGAGGQEGDAGGDAARFGIVG